MDNTFINFILPIAVITQLNDYSLNIFEKVKFSQSTFKSDSSSVGNILVSGGSIKNFVDYKTKIVYITSLKTTGNLYLKDAFT